MTYEVIILGHLHMPLYFIGTFTEYSYKDEYFLNQGTKTKFFLEKK